MKNLAPVNENNDIPRRKDIDAVDKSLEELGLDTVLIGGEQTTVSEDDGGDNVYTFWDIQGQPHTITVKNGSKGSQGIQ